MPIRLRVAGKEDAELWDSIVSKSSSGTIFHTWKWQGIIEKHSGTKLYPLIAYNEEEPIGIFPLFLMKKFMFRLVFSPPPLGSIPYMGPVIADYESMKQSKKDYLYKEFIEAADAYIHTHLRPHYVRIRTSLGMTDSRPFSWTCYSVRPEYTYLIDIKPDTDVILDSFKKQLRRDINIAKSKGVEIREGSRQDFDFVVNSLMDRFEDKGVKSTLNKEYLSDLFDAFAPENIRVYSAYLNGEVVSGIILLCYNKLVLGWIGPPSAGLKGVPVNDLLHWAVIQKMHSEGFAYYDLVCADPWEFCPFKLKYSPSLSMYFTFAKYNSAFFKSIDSLRNLFNKKSV